MLSLLETRTRLAAVSLSRPTLFNFVAKRNNFATITFKVNSHLTRGYCTLGTEKTLSPTLHSATLAPRSAPTMQTKLWTPSVEGFASSGSIPHKPISFPLPSVNAGDVSSVPSADEIMTMITSQYPSLSTLASLLEEPASLLRSGETIAFPTETVYGLGANALDSDAIGGIYRAKGRPSDNPLIVHVSSASQLDSLATYVCPLARRLMGAFWPGPLTIILPDAGKASARVTAGLNTVGIRMPSHPIALALIEAAGVPLAAPSANTSGRPSPTTAAHVFDDLNGRIAGIVRGPDVLVSDWAGDEATGQGAVTRMTQCEFGVESTVVDVSHLSPDQDVEVVMGDDGQSVLRTEGAPLAYILRPGGVTKAMLEEVIGVGRVEFDPTLLISVDQAFEDEERDQDPLLIQSEVLGGLQPRAPGMKYTHYAPRAPLFVVVGTTTGDINSDLEALEGHITMAKQKGRRVGVLTTYEMQSHFSPLADVVLPCGSRKNMLSIAAQLYDTLRLFDDHEVDVIYAESFQSDNLGAAVMNRLLKAAGGKVLRGFNVV